MRREELEHVIRAAAEVARDDEIVIVGSQAILGQLPDAPQALLKSPEADAYPKNHPDRAIEIDGALGEGSPFHEAFATTHTASDPRPPRLPPAGRSAWSPCA